MSSENLPSAQHAALAEVAEVEAQLGEKPLAVAATSGIKRSALATFLWALPATLWLSVFLLAPVVMIVLVSFWTRNTNGFDAWNWTTENYRTLLDTDVVPDGAPADVPARRVRLHPRASRSAIRSRTSSRRSRACARR